MLRLKGVTAGYHDGDSRTVVLHGVDLVVYGGEIVSLVGASGSGKSTLLGVIAGLQRPTAGTIVVGEHEISGSDEQAWARLRAEHIGVVQQSGNLIPFLTATENVELAMRFTTSGRRRGRAREMLNELGLGDRADHLGRHLSGGEAQRTAVAVALANEPDLLLADEVTGELDRETAERVMDVLEGLATDRGLSILFVTHDLVFAARAHRQLRLADGRVTTA